MQLKPTPSFIFLPSTPAKTPNHTPLVSTEGTEDSKAEWLEDESSQAEMTV